MVTRRTLFLGAGAVALGSAAYLSLRPRPDYDAAAAAIRTIPAATGSADADYLIAHAVLAANSHNTQAWRFRVRADEVSIVPDLTRATPAADPDLHHLYASLGCAAENLILAARQTGQTAEHAFDDGNEGAVRIALGAQGAVADPLFGAITTRQCTRSDYDGKSVAAADLAKLGAAAKLDGAEVILIEDRAQIDQVLDLILAANSTQVSDPAFAAELRSWIRFNPADAIRQGDGLYAACSGNPTMPGWLGRAMFGLVFKPDAENDRYARQVRSSSGLAVVVTARDDRAHWVTAGRAYQRFALQATLLGIRHAFVNQAVEVPAQRTALASLLGLGSRRPDLLLRYGYGAPMPYSLRRPVADVMVAA